MSSTSVFWKLNVFFIAVPLVARMGFNVPLELFCLYLASILLLIAALITRFCTPKICTFSDPREFRDSGYLLKHLKSHYQQVKKPDSRIQSVAVATLLDSDSDTASADPEVFEFVQKTANETKSYRRWATTLLISFAVLIIIVVNLLRLWLVVQHVFLQARDTGAIFMIPESSHPSIGDFLSVGKQIDVTHEAADGPGKASTTVGKLLNTNDDGFLVVETTEGDKRKQIHIPKDRIISMSQDVAN